MLLTKDIFTSGHRLQRIHLFFFYQGLTLYNVGTSNVRRFEKLKKKTLMLKLPKNNSPLLTCRARSHPNTTLFALLMNCIEIYNPIQITNLIRNIIKQKQWVNENIQYKLQI